VDNVNPLTTRKFIMVSVALLLTFAALFAGKLIGSEVVTLVTLELGIFVGGNVVAKHKAFVEGSKQ